MTENERITSGYAALSEQSDDENIVHGVAIGEGDVTKGGSGKVTEWPAEVLQDAAELFEGVPIVKDHPNISKTANGLKMEGHAPIDAKVGEVTKAKYKDGVGLLWQGRITDDEILGKVKDGIAEVSPVLRRDLEQLSDSKYRATEVRKVRDLGIVSKGAAESNTIQTGAAALSAEALTEAFESDVEALKEVAGVEFDDTMGGKLDESEIPNDDYESHYLYPEDTKSDSSYPVVDAEGNLRKGNVDAAWGLGARGGIDEDEHDRRLMELAQEFDSPPEWADDESESMGLGVRNPSNWEACSVSLPQELTQNDDGANEPSPQSSVAGNSEETMTEEDTLTENEKAILKAAEDVEDASEALNEYAATEGPEIVESSEYESLKEQVDTAKDLYAESLSERWDTDKDKIKSNFGLEALREEFETEDGDLDTEALIQNPESGEPEEDDTEALSDDANVEKAEALYEDMQSFDVDHKDTITEALGVSEWDDAKEVLN